MQGYISLYVNMAKHVGRLLAYTCEVDHQAVRTSAMGSHASACMVLKRSAVAWTSAEVLKACIMQPDSSWVSRLSRLAAEAIAACWNRTDTCSVLCGSDMHSTRRCLHADRCALWGWHSCARIHAVSP